MIHQTGSIFRILLVFFCFTICAVSPVIAQETESSLTEFTSPTTEMKFIQIPAGCFNMGSDEGFDFESPVHEVCVDKF